jgi:hypothetical protein
MLLLLQHHLADESGLQFGRERGMLFLTVPIAAMRAETKSEDQFQWLDRS